MQKRILIVVKVKHMIQVMARRCLFNNLFNMIVNWFDYMQHCGFTLAWSRVKPLKLPVSNLQLHIFVFVVFKHIKTKIKRCLKHSCGYTHSNTHSKIFTLTKKSFSLSPVLQNLFVRTGSRHWSLECEDIFPKHKTVLAENQALPAFSRPSFMHCLWGPPVHLQPEPNLSTSL